MDKEEALSLAQEIATGSLSNLFAVEGFTSDRRTGYALILRRVGSDRTFELRRLDGGEDRLHDGEVAQEWRRRKETGFRVPE